MSYFKCHFIKLWYFYRSYRYRMFRKLNRDLWSQETDCLFRFVPVVLAFFDVGRVNELGRFSVRISRARCLATCKSKPILNQIWPQTCSWNVKKARLELGGVNLSIEQILLSVRRKQQWCWVFVFMGVSIYSPGDNLLARIQTNKQTNKRNCWKCFGLVEFVLLLGNRYVRFAVKFVRVMNVMRTPVIMSEERDFFKCTRGCWYVLSPTRKETSYGDQNRDIFNILPTKLNALLSSFL